MRRCHEHGCATVLSRYNPGRGCFIHTEPAWDNGGTRRKREELEGLHPEDLQHDDQRRIDIAWEGYRRHWLNREIRDLMEA